MRFQKALLLGVVVSTAWGADSQVCAGCHADIFKRYLKTPMARTSGVVGSVNAPLAITTEFLDSQTATQFRLARKGGGTFLSFAQVDAAGERRLDYFLGAGLTGRSYASSIDGFLLQAPASYYRATGRWDLSPGYEDSDHLNLTRPVEPGCLNCHASGLRVLPDTVNGYENPPFAEDGVSC